EVRRGGDGVGEGRAGLRAEWAPGVAVLGAEAAGRRDGQDDRPPVVLDDNEPADGPAFEGPDLLPAQMPSPAHHGAPVSPRPPARLPVRGRGEPSPPLPR